MGTPNQVIRIAEDIIKDVEERDRLNSILTKVQNDEITDYSFEIRDTTGSIFRIAASKSDAVSRLTAQRTALNLNITSQQARIDCVT